MGLMRQGIAVLTTWEKPLQDKLDAWMETLSDTDRNIVVSTRPLVNAYRTYAVVCDGSKEGWAESDRADQLRKELMDFADENEWADAVWIEFGGDAKRGPITEVRRTRYPVEE